MAKRTMAGIAYEERGSGLPLLAIHGWSPDRRLMIGALEPVFDAEGRAKVPPSAVAGRPEGGRTRHSYRRIYPDLPFMGESADLDWIEDSDGMLRAMEGFIGEVLPSEPFLLAGESYGGYLARGLARSMPDRIAGIAFICPAIVMAKGARDRPPLAPSRVEEGYAAGVDPAVVEEFESVAVVRDRYCLSRSAAEVVPGVRIARQESLDRIAAKGYAFSFDRLGRAGDPGGAFDAGFDRPCLFVLGARDASVGWRDALRLADRYPRASYAILDGAGHNAQIESTGIEDALIGEWLARCEAGA